MSFKRDGDSSGDPFAKKFKSSSPQYRLTAIDQLTAKVFYGKLSHNHALLLSPKPKPILAHYKIEQKFELAVKWLPSPQNSKLFIKPCGNSGDWEWTSVDFNKELFLQCRDTLFFQLNTVGGMSTMKLLVQMESTVDWDIFSHLLKYEGAIGISTDNLNRLSILQKQNMNSVISEFWTNYYYDDSD